MKNAILKLEAEIYLEYIFLNVIFNSVESLVVVNTSLPFCIVFVGEGVHIWKW